MTVDQQVDIALQKAGIGRGEAFSVERFTVSRYREGEPPRDDEVDEPPAPVELTCRAPQAHDAAQLRRWSLCSEPPRSARRRWRSRSPSALHADIVVADSMQVYAGLPIVTNQPDEAQRARARHHLVGFVPPQREFTVAEYAGEAHEVIDGLRHEGRAVIVEGGSGLYLRAALGDLEFAAPPDAALRRDARGALGARPERSAGGAAPPRPRRPRAPRRRQPAPRRPRPRGRARQRPASAGRRPRPSVAVGRALCAHAGRARTGRRP